MKRLLAFCLALCLVLTVLPVPGTAAEWSRMQIEPQIQVNPLYAGLLNEEDLDLELPARQNYALFATSKYLSEEEAVEAIRENMKNRISNFTIYVAVPRTGFDVKAYIRDMLEKAQAHTGDPLEGDSLRWQMGGWAYSASGRVTAGETLLEIPFAVDYYTTAEQEAELDIAVDALLNELALDQKCDYEKVWGIYNYIISNITYDHDNLNDKTYTLKHTAYAALMHKTAVCQGYALLFYRLALELGVDVRLVPGDSDGDGELDHGWNIVELNGLYYCLDATWDAGWPWLEWFLRSPDNFVDHDPMYDHVESGFEESYSMTETDFVHIVTETVTDPTCTEMGYTTYACNCGQSYTDTYTDPTGHSLVNGICTVCGMSDSLGDVNLDGNVDMDDAVVLMRHVLKAEMLTESSALANGEVTHNDTLDMDDVVKLMQYVLKAIESLD